MLAPSFICTYYWWLYFRQFEYFNLYWQAFCGLECPVLEMLHVHLRRRCSSGLLSSCPVHLWWLLCICTGSCAPALAPVHPCWLLCTCAGSCAPALAPCTCTGSCAPSLAPCGSQHHQHPLLSLLKPVLVIAQSDILKHPILTLYTLLFQSVNFASDIWRLCY